MAISFRERDRLCWDPEDMVLETPAHLTYPFDMRSVEEIEAEIAKLTPAEVRKVAKWLEKFLAEEWDKQIESDAKNGRLDFLFEEAEAERKAGRLRDWPEDKS
jgi:hypothetical protein